jgi:hypothetical protein
MASIKNLKVTKISESDNGLEFEDGYLLRTVHEQDCCELHYLNFDDLDIADFDGLEFDLSGGSFFNRITGYGIELVPNSGFTIKVAGHADSNGYYSSNLSLEVVHKNVVISTFDIEECQSDIDV